MNEQINEALRQLDPSNDEHWTGSGLPNILIVSKLSGVATLTRKQLADARPGFNREMAKIPDVPNEPNLADDVDSLVPAEIAPKSLSEQRDTLQIDLAEVQAKIHGLHAVEIGLLDSIDRLSTQIDRETPPAQTTEAIQAFLTSQAKQRKETPTGLSPLDQAMARKRPTSRPSYPVAKQ